MLTVRKLCEMKVVWSHENLAQKCGLTTLKIAHQRASINGSTSIEAKEATVRLLTLARCGELAI